MIQRNACNGERLQEETRAFIERAEDLDNAIRDQNDPLLQEARLLVEGAKKSEASGDFTGAKQQYTRSIERYLGLIKIGDASNTGVPDAATAGSVGGRARQEGSRRSQALARELETVFGRAEKVKTLLESRRNDARRAPLDAQQYEADAARAEARGERARAYALYEKAVESVLEMHELEKDPNPNLARLWHLQAAPFASQLADTLAGLKKHMEERKWRRKAENSIKERGGAERAQNEDDGRQKDDVVLVVGGEHTASARGSTDLGKTIVSYPQALGASFTFSDLELPGADYRDSPSALPLVMLQPTKSAEAAADDNDSAHKGQRLLMLGVDVTLPEEERRRIENAHFTAALEARAKANATAKMSNSSEVSSSSGRSSSTNNDCSSSSSSSSSGGGGGGGGGGSAGGAMALKVISHTVEISGQQ